MKNRKLIAMLIAMLCCLCLLFVACNDTPNNPTPPPDDDPSVGIAIGSEVKNVIIIIGDGMGFNHIESTKLQYDIDNFAFEPNFLTPVATRSKSHPVTDSAAAATAMATGTKTNNNNVSMLAGQPLKNIMEIAKENGKKTGVVTTDNLFGATPAAFSAHSRDRHYDEEIVRSQAQVGVDLLVGQKPDEDEDLYSTTCKQDFIDNGYAFASTVEELTQNPKDQKVVANIDGMRSKYNDTLDYEKADFQDIISYTLDYLDNDNGFCLMIEHAHVDKCSHSNDLYGAMCEVRALADTVEQVYAFCQDRNDTAVLITADHETGGLQLANSKEELTNDRYTTKNHTAADVPLYVTNVTVTGIQDRLDNTYIFMICKMIVENNVVRRDVIYC